MKTIEEQTRVNINNAVKHYFRLHGISHRMVAERLGYSSANIVDNQLSRGHFGKRIAAKWAREFGFNESFLMTGRGRLTVRRSGYQKLVQEIESLRSIVNSQRITIEKLRAQLT